MTPFETRLDPPLMIRSRRDVLLHTLRTVAPALAVAGLATFAFVSSAGSILLTAAALLSLWAVSVSRTPRATLIVSERELAEGRLRGWIEVESAETHWTLSSAVSTSQVEGQRRGAVVIVPLDLPAGAEEAGVAALRARPGSGSEVRFAFRVIRRR